MKKRALLTLAAVTSLGLATGVASAATQVVTSVAPTDSTAGVWGVSDSGGSGAVSIVSNAPAGDPLGPGAGVITTTNSNADKKEIGLANNYGLASNIISSIKLAYSYYKDVSSVSPDPDPAAAPSIKLSFLNSTYAAGGNDGFVTLIYEPYWNNGVGTVTTGTWFTDSIDATHGKFWENGGFGQASGAGGPPLNTLADWLTAFDSTSSGAFSNATLTEVRIGMGTYNPAQTGYFDNVTINGTSQADTTYNFEAAVVPLPKAAYAGLGLIAGIGLLGGLKRRQRKLA
jgi:hypothetical protein